MSLALFAVSGLLFGLAGGGKVDISDCLCANTVTLYLKKSKEYRMLFGTYFAN